MNEMETHIQQIIENTKKSIKNMEDIINFLSGKED